MQNMLNFIKKDLKCLKLLNIVKKRRKAIYFTTQRYKNANISIICEENDFNVYILL